MISVVVPNFNSGEILKKNFPKLVYLLEKTDLDYEIIVTDDASTDDSVEVLEKLKIKVVQSDVNTGFGTNIDRGIRAASGEVVFILNAIDLIPKDESYFELMLAHFEDKKVFSVAASKQDSENHGSGKIYFEKGFFLHQRGNGKLTDWADGGAQALRKEYYFKIGGFDPIYKFYWEDVDLGFRATKAGYKIIYEPRAILLHEKAEGPIAKNYSERELRRMNLYGQYIFTLKNSELKQKLLFFFWQPYHLAVALKNRDWDWFKALIQVI